MAALGSSEVFRVLRLLEESAQHSVFLNVTAPDGAAPLNPYASVFVPNSEYHELLAEELQQCAPPNVGKFTVSADPNSDITVPDAVSDDLAMKPIQIMRMPREVRDNIYEHLIGIRSITDKNFWDLSWNGSKLLCPELLQANSCTRYEYLSMFLSRGLLTRLECTLTTRDFNPIGNLKFIDENQPPSDFKVDNLRGLLGNFKPFYEAVRPDTMPPVSLRPYIRNIVFKTRVIIPPGHDDTTADWRYVFHKTLKRLSSMPNLSRVHLLITVHIHLPLWLHPVTSAAGKWNPWARIAKAMTERWCSSRLREYAPLKDVKVAMWDARLPLVKCFVDLQRVQGEEDGWQARGRASLLSGVNDDFSADNLLDLDNCDEEIITVRLGPTGRSRGQVQYETI